MTHTPESLRTTAQRLELEIQIAWDKANTALLRDKQDVEEVKGLIVALRHCASRSGAIGFTTGEKELLRMARYLEGRISTSDFPRYGTG
jgi:hypothetical protein